MGRRQYIVSIKVGSRIFSPTIFTTLLTVVLIALLISLGRWQLRRADEKRVLFDSFAAGTDATQTIDLRTPSLRRYQHIEAVGHYDQSRQVLIDNMVNAERAGYFVITPFAVADDTRHVRGRADHMPSPGIQLGERAELKPPFPVVAPYPSRAEIAGLLHETSWTSATDLVLLDPGEPDGYVRDWSAPGFPPMRHLAYAVQWFALALTLLVIYVVTNLRRADAPGRGGVSA